MDKKSVLVGVSGGVDSTVAACKLIAEGYHVEGLYIDNGYPSRAISDAADACDKINIPLHTINVAHAFRESVVDYFVSEYAAGRTPNPCAVCNKLIKFKYLLEEADRHGFFHIATGHYCRIEYDDLRGIFSLLRGVDTKKDQSYFLFCLGQKELSRLLFPNGNNTKEEIMALSLAEGFGSKSHMESQEICFIPDNDYRCFIESYTTDNPFIHGDIVTLQGKVVGRHRGIHSVTIGQRRGLNIASERPYYVYSIDTIHNRVVVARDEEQWCRGLSASGVSWTDPDFWENTPLRVFTCIRYRHKGVLASITPLTEDRRRVTVTFDSPQKAVAPGQAVVFYDCDRVLGGGWIEEVIRHA